MGGGIGAFGGSTVNAQDADCSGAGGDGIVVTGGSTVNAQAANAGNSGGRGFLWLRGSMINATAATGTTGANPVNTLSPDGICFK